MNKTLLVALILGTTALAGVMYTNKSTTSFLSQVTDDYTQYQQWMSKYKKSYGPDETHFRFVTFQSNLALINNHNSVLYPNQATYFLGVNQFADMTVAEFSSKMLGYKRTTPKVSKKVAPINLSVPASVDWTTKGAVTPVKDQGQCGSCWAFSSTGSLEGLNFIKNGNLLSFSEQQLVDCSSAQGNQGCNGGLMDQAFQYVEANGITTESQYPYTAEDGTCSYTSSESAFKNTGYTDVTANNEAAMLSAIAQGPVSVAIEADTSAFQLYAGGILNDSSCGTSLDHGVLAVGYGSNFYKVKNSWAASWGEQGYVRLARTGNDAGMCGIQMDASYPTA